MAKMEIDVACPLKQKQKKKKKKNLCFTVDMWVIFITDIGKMNLMKFFMHSTTTMKILN